MQPIGSGSMHMPFGTSLRMGRLGYQSDAQASLAVSYNGLEGYAASLHDALTRPYPAYEAVGIRNPGGDYNQLATTLLQIENEFYGTIRPKRTIFPGERPLHALRERGVEYVEVRLLDLDPFVPIGITEQTLHLLDVFLMHCLLADSPPDTPREIDALKRNQHLTAARGREPGLMLERDGQPVALVDWGLDILAQCEPIAQRLDAVHGGEAHQHALRHAQHAMTRPDTLPSAHVLHAMEQHYGNSFVRFTMAQSLRTRERMLAMPLMDDERQVFEAMAQQSEAGQKAIEDNDSLPFEQYRLQYISPQRLGAPRSSVQSAAANA
ncbi:MAG: hypothetical protein EBS99_15860 [Betaproteobacteria bacterium]|nr:hypothetical protein [Betaproteobacteria bacterium]